ncbi:IS110 family transposase [Rhodococcus qingshengii]|uniref:IS110 family transposase n=1 Tax=Rhodococcus qingshengii TaxID=334542 RepID=UPI00301AEBC6
MLYLGDDWAEDHHDIELQNPAGKRLAKARLEEGVAGVARLHELVAQHNDGKNSEVVVGIETDRGPWVLALIATGYQVFAINPLQVARYRERRTVSGAKSDAGDAHTLADMVRTDSHQLRPVAGDSDLVEAIKVVARSHKTLITERTRHVLRLRQALREYFPAALHAFDDLSSADALELLAKAPTPSTAARLSITPIRNALRRARRRNVIEKAETLKAVLRSKHLAQSDRVAEAYAAVVRSLVAVLETHNDEIASLAGEVETLFGRHPDAAVYLSQPGLGPILGARVLAEFGDDPDRYADASARKNYAGTSPITRACGKKKYVLARYVHNDRLVDALGRQAYTTLTASSGARSYYDELRARGISHHAALRQLTNRMVGILHGCLKSQRDYDETTAWAHRERHSAA